MTAQVGNALVLTYGPQGAQQAGSALVLRTITPAPELKLVAGGVAARWSKSTPQTRRVRVLAPLSSGADIGTSSAWREGQRKNSPVAVPWAKADPVDAAEVVHWAGPMARTHASVAAVWPVAKATDAVEHARWAGPMARTQQTTSAPWTGSRAADVAEVAHWAGPMARIQRGSVAVWGRADTTQRTFVVLWSRVGRSANSGVEVTTPPVPTPAPNTTFYIYPARFYMAVHSLTATRVRDGADVPLFGCTVSADVGSFGWSLSATMPYRALDLISSGEELLHVEIDGIPFVFLAERWAESEQFGQRSLSIQGRSQTALLGAPWQRATMRSNSSAMTAQQLAWAALQYTGVDLDWGLTDWLVPAGVWSHQGTPLEAIGVIAAAAGGYLQSHRTDATLLVRHPYPMLPGGVPGGPWNWPSASAVDVELATDAVMVRSSDSDDGADIDGVYVRGAGAGVVALVKRGGTAGANLADMVTDPLITHADAASQRGTAILGKAGKVRRVSIDSPILTGAQQPGIFDVGQLVQVNAIAPWRGRVRSVSATATRFEKIRQTIALEVHP